MDKFQKELGLLISTVYHPQIDGQNERTIQTLEDIIGMPPYEMLYGRKCCTLGYWGEVGQRGLANKKEVKPRFIGPFKIIARIRSVAYRLELPEELNGIHDTFHVSYLRKCLADESAYVPLEDLEIDDKLSYVEKPVTILDRKVKHLRKKALNQVKVQWKNRRGSDATWESENEMRKY
ncbi:hypothetical protein E3N88_29417 [Mikania micrantha]|uniref:Tf2-1-like SH3-like domain-containing protein n=1 Tax=Mikania micrantha TaxID=192012 RepID=A0A5N6MLM5_9ASTR|nr:hypothetical protein E3N88_29417 [Mikania micrantha]